MSGNLWELEKFRRRLGFTHDELRSDALELTKKKQGVKPQDVTEDITRNRKARRQRREEKYWECLEELVAVFEGDFPKGKAVVERLIELLGNDPKAHAVLVDCADCLLRIVLKSNNLWDSDRDHLEGARFYAARLEPPDGRERRKHLSKQIKIVETLLRELREAEQIT